MCQRFWDLEPAVHQFRDWYNPSRLASRHSVRALKAGLVIWSLLFCLTVHQQEPWLLPDASNVALCKLHGWLGSILNGQTILAHIHHFPPAALSAPSLFRYASIIQRCEQEFLSHVFLEWHPIRFRRACPNP